MNAASAFGCRRTNRGEELAAPGLELVGVYAAGCSQKACGFKRVTARAHRQGSLPVEEFVFDNPKLVGRLAYDR